MGRCGLPRSRTNHRSVRCRARDTSPPPPRRADRCGRAAGRKAARDTAPAGAGYSDTTALARRTAFASSSTAMACSRDTLGKSLRKASRDSPFSRSSMSVCTGTRVPAKTGVPLKRPGDVVISGSGTCDMARSFTHASSMRVPSVTDRHVGLPRRPMSMQCRSHDEARDALHLPLAVERTVLNGLSRKQLAKVARVEKGML